jgi:hypothetical protein
MVADCVGGRGKGGIGMGERFGIVGVFVSPIAQDQQPHKTATHINIHRHIDSYAYMHTSHNYIHTLVYVRTFFFPKNSTTWSCSFFGSMPCSRPSTKEKERGRERESDGVVMCEKDGG